MKRARAAAALPLLLLAGCSHFTPWLRSRTTDLADSIPISVGWGWGIGVSARATSFFELGLGLTPIVCNRWGYEDRTFHGVWHELDAGLPWSLYMVDLDLIPAEPRGTGRGPLDPPPLFWRWQVRRDAPSGEGHLPGRWEVEMQQWGRHPPLSREAFGAFILPERTRELNWHDVRQEQGDPAPLAKLGTPTSATLWRVTRDGPPAPRSWDLFELDAFAGILGLRVGVRPVEFVDFLLGWVGIDIMDDDFHKPESNEPIPPPSAEPAAEPEPPPQDTAPAEPEPAAEPPAEPEPQPQPPTDPEPPAT